MKMTTNRIRISRQAINYVEVRKSLLSNILIIGGLVAASLLEDSRKRIVAGCS